jgi:flagellar export protein FliJ
MKKFTFRFEAVERQRGVLLDTRTAELAEAQRKRRMAEGLLAQRRETLAAAQRGPGVPFDARQELIRQRYLHALRQEIARREQQLRLIDAEIDEARNRVTQAHRDLRAIELLRERDHDEWRADVRRAEGAEIDEHNSNRRRPVTTPPGTPR